MAPTALALGLLWSAAADVVLGPRTRNGASLVNIAKLPLHTKGTSILVDDHWVVGTLIYQQLITGFLFSEFFRGNHVSFF